jgi:hypothetical protein
MYNTIFLLVAFIKETWKRVRKKATSKKNVLYKDTLTNDHQPFLISDNKKRNRILIFSSPKILSKYKKCHGDGPFMTPIIKICNYILI